MENKVDRRKSSFSLYLSSWKWELPLAILLISLIAFLLTPPHLDEPYKASGIPDFAGYYSAAKIAYSGNSDKIYDVAFQHKTLQEVAGSDLVRQLPYLYPPQGILYFIPLAPLSLETAFLIWQAVNIAASVALLCLLLYYANYREKSGALLTAALLTITSYPWVVAIQHGQTILLMTLGLWGCQLLAKNRRVIPAAILIVLTAYKPQILIGPVFYLVIIYPRLWVALLAVSLGCSIISSLIFGFSIWQSYITILALNSQAIEAFNANVPSMGNLRALTLLFFEDGYFSTINKVSSILWAANILATILLAFKIKKRSVKMQEIGFAMSVATSCFFSPWLHIHSFVMLMIPAACLIKYVTLQPRYIFIGCLVNFNLLAMYIDGLKPSFNSVIWVPAQLTLILFIFRHMQSQFTISNKNPAIS